MEIEINKPNEYFKLTDLSVGDCFFMDQDSYMFIYLKHNFIGYYCFASGKQFEKTRASLADVLVYKLKIEKIIFQQVSK